MIYYLFWCNGWQLIRADSVSDAKQQAKDVLRKTGVPEGYLVADVGEWIRV